MLAWLQSELVESDRIERAARLDVLDDDRLDGRIDTATYDKKARAIPEQQEQIRQKIRSAEAAILPSASEATDQFLEQVGAGQRKLIRLVLKEAS